LREITSLAKISPLAKRSLTSGIDEAFIFLFLPRKRLLNGNYRREAKEILNLGTSH